MSSDPLLDPVRSALNGVHAHFAVGHAPARRYPSEVAPFAVIDDTSEPTLARLEALMAPGDQVYIFDEPPSRMNGLSAGPPLHTFQMLGPEHPTVDARDEGCSPMLMMSEDAGEMFELITLAFPGFYQPRTHEMGTYYGIRIDGRLVAMAGERLCMTGYREISGVCTHPDARGRGYAGHLMSMVIDEIEREGKVPFLHAFAQNPAIRLYERLGFTLRQRFNFAVLAPEA